MTVTLAQISADVGEMYASVYGGTTSVSAMITRAQNFVKLATSTTTGYDAVIRPLADAFVVNHILGGIDPVNKTIGSLSVGAKDLGTMQKFFMNEAKKAAVMKGVSLDGLTIQFVDTETV